MLGPWKKTEARRADERKTNTGVNGEVKYDQWTLEEIWAKYGKPGDTNGYESPPLYGSSRRGER